MSMDEVTFGAGTSIEKACAELYQRSLFGEFLYTDFNGVRISMYPKLKQGD